MELFESSNSDILHFEKLAVSSGYRYIAGVDEVGRGPLAGPVVSAAVILDLEKPLPGVTDSKALTPQKREALYDIIMAEAVAVGIGICSHEIIDRINILNASLLSMKKAVQKLTIRPDFLLVDGKFKIPMRLPQRPVVKGDSLSLSIGAASIIAKVTRDRLMARYGLKYPGYGFSDHMGYACASHRAAIADLGPCAIHRKTFSCVAEYLPPELRPESMPALFQDE